MSRLFRPFEQPDAHLTKKYEGIGLYCARNSLRCTMAGFGQRASLARAVDLHSQYPDDNCYGYEEVVEKRILTVTFGNPHFSLPVVFADYQVDIATVFSLLDKD